MCLTDKTTDKRKQAAVTKPRGGTSSEVSQARGRTSSEFRRTVINMSEGGAEVQDRETIKAPPDYSELSGVRAGDQVRTDPSEELGSTGGSTSSRLPEAGNNDDSRSALGQVLSMLRDLREEQQVLKNSKFCRQDSTVLDWQFLKLPKYTRQGTIR